MKLFWTPASPFVRKVMVTAIELNLQNRIEIHPTFWPHEWGSRTVKFDDEFIGANPIGRIPTLITDDGIAIPESNWICEYLDSLSGKPTLLPRSGPERWKAVRALAIADGAIEAMIARRAESLRKGAEKSQDFLGKQRDRIARCLDTIEREITALETGLTLAHISTGIGCGYMDFRYPEDNWRNGRPRVAEWYQNFAVRPSMVKTVPAETPERKTA